MNTHINFFGSSFNDYKIFDSGQSVTITVVTRGEARYSNDGKTPPDKEERIEIYKKDLPQLVLALQKILY